MPAPARLHPTIQQALDAICHPAVPTPAIPSALRRDLIHIYDEWHSGWLEYPDSREWERSRHAQSIYARAEDLLEDVSRHLFGDRWALGATLEDVAKDVANGAGLVEAASALGHGDVWTAAWLHAARRYAECGR